MPSGGSFSCSLALLLSCSLALALALYASLLAFSLLTLLVPSVAEYGLVLPGTTTTVRTYVRTSIV